MHCSVSNVSSWRLFTQIWRVLTPETCTWLISLHTHWKLPHINIIHRIFTANSPQIMPYYAAFFPAFFAIFFRNFPRGQTIFHCNQFSQPFWAQLMRPWSVQPAILSSADETLKGPNSYLSQDRVLVSNCFCLYPENFLLEFHSNNGSADCQSHIQEREILIIVECHLSGRHLSEHVGYPTSPGVLILWLSTVKF